jgi:hypothetical protein
LIVKMFCKLDPGRVGVVCCGGGLWGGWGGGGGAPPPPGGGECRCVCVCVPLITFELIGKFS